MATLASALVASGCGTSTAERTSTRVATEDLNLDATAESDGVDTFVMIQVFDRRGTIRFAGGDRMRLYAGGESQILRDVEDDDGVIGYEATFGEVAGPYEIKIVRPHEESVDGLEIPMPPAFALAGPTAVTTGWIDLAWDASDDAGYASELLVEGSCVSPLRRALAADTGEYAIHTTEITRTAPGACSLSISLRRSASAEQPLLPYVDAGSLRATSVQARAIAVEWEPL
jgi:hypothetical protein